MSKIATLEEIERTWTYQDIMKANAMLDMREDYESYLQNFSDNLPKKGTRRK